MPPRRGGRGRGRGRSNVERNADVGAERPDAQPGAPPPDSSNSNNVATGPPEDDDVIVLSDSEPMDDSDDVVVLSHRRPSVGDDIEQPPRRRPRLSDGVQQPFHYGASCNAVAVQAPRRGVDQDDDVIVLSHQRAPVDASSAGPQHFQATFGAPVNAAIAGPQYFQETDDTAEQARQHEEGVDFIMVHPVERYRRAMMAEFLRSLIRNDMYRAPGVEWELVGTPDIYQEKPMRGRHGFCR